MLSPDPSLVREAAEKFAAQLAQVAATADKEEAIRIACERELGRLEDAAGIRLRGEPEFTVASGFVDSVYDRVIIEYKNPSSPADRIGPSAQSPGTLAVVGQIKSRFTDLQQEQGQPLNTLFGVGLDGKYFVFVRYLEDSWRVQPPIEVNKYSSERFLWALFNLGIGGKGYTPAQLAKDFGADAVTATAGVRALYEGICSTDDDRALTLFQEWQLLFGEVGGYEIAKPSDKIVELAASYEVERNSLRPVELIFAIHTYYALLIKLLAAEIVSSYHRLPGRPLERLLNAGSTAALKRELDELESGSVFVHFNIKNFLEGDLFSWYLSTWSDGVERLVREMTARLDEYNPATLSEDPAESRDLLKHLYQQLFPKSVRHDLGEYYTPDWLAEHVLERVGYDGNPVTRVLDPACGSGTFLVLALARIRRWYELNRETCAMDERDLCQAMLANVVGFDLNPLAVMAARTNYLIAIRDVMERVPEVEIPVYLSDSITTPTEHGDLFLGHGAAIRVPCAARKPPQLLVPREVAGSHTVAARYASILEHCIRVGLTTTDFLQRCSDEGIEVLEADLHSELYENLIELKRQGRNGIWARIIKNAFAPLFCGQFDLVVGNPPWVNWENLPADYRLSSDHVWQLYDLIGQVPRARRQRSNRSKTDVAALMTYVAADKYLVDHGKLGFVITKSLFQSELGGWHFRAFKLPDGVPLGLTIVDDFERVKPFKGQAANNTVTMLLEKGKVTEYPIPWKAHRPKQRRQQIAEDATREEAIAAITTRDWTARPVDTSDHQSALISGEPAIVDILVPLLGSSPYGPLAREGINTRGANGVYFLDAAEVHGRLLVVNRADDGDDRSLPARQQTLESEFVYPLLKGADVQRWRASPSAYVLLPHVASAPNSPVAFAQLPAKTQEFLSAFRRKLESRTAFRNFDPSGSEWYGLYSVLTATFSPVKVVWREQARGSIAAVVEGAAVPTSSHKLIVPDHKLFIIPLESVDEANFVCAMLNSSISAYLIRSYALSTGISTHILERLPIPRYQRRIPAHEKIAQFGRQIASLARTATPDQIAEAEHELDVAVGKLFGLSKHDVNLVRIALADLDQ